MIDEPELKPSETLVSTLRHGLTELNRDKRVGGRLDVPLLEAGRQQARQAQLRFGGTPLDVVISSPLQRAVETAVIVTGWPAERILIDPLCLERSFGEMDGLTREQVEARFPEIRYLQIDHIGYSLNPPGGESFEALRARAQHFFDQLLAQHQGKRILVSSHQNFLQQLHGLILGRNPFDSLRTDLLNLELNQFHLALDGALIRSHRHVLVPDAAKHASF